MRPLIAIFLSFMLSVSVLSASEDWIESGSLEGLQELTAEDRQRIGTLVEHRTIGYTFRDEGVSWRIHRGNLTLPDHFDNAHALVVDGDLEIQGSYDDCPDRHGRPGLQPEAREA